MGGSTEEKEMSLRAQLDKADRDAWTAYWKQYDLETRGTYYPRMRYYVQKWFDKPATWFRERIVEPLNEKHRLPYYHYRYPRVPEIDECGVRDLGCIFEAQEQFRRDRMVDEQILELLRRDLDRCMMITNNDQIKCTPLAELMEENSLNYYIKYGNLGSEATVVDAYMKMKHRLIWERRHPEVVAERNRLLKEHKEKIAAGNPDLGFWKNIQIYTERHNYEPFEYHPSKPSYAGDKPISKDLEYYRQLAKNPDLDKKQ